MKKKTEIVITRVNEMPEEEQRVELIRLRDMCLEEVASAQRVMNEYIKRANQCTRMLQEMDGTPIAYGENAVIETSEERKDGITHETR